VTRFKEQEASRGMEVLDGLDAEIGERITVPDFDFESEEAAPFAENKIGKKKVFEKIAPHLVRKIEVHQCEKKPLDDERSARGK